MLHKERDTGQHQQHGYTEDIDKGEGCSYTPSYSMEIGNQAGYEYSRRAMRSEYSNLQTPCTCVPSNTPRSIASRSRRSKPTSTAILTVSAAVLLVGSVVEAAAVDSSNNKGKGRIVDQSELLSNAQYAAQSPHYTPEYAMTAGKSSPQTRRGRDSPALPARGNSNSSTRRRSINYQGDSSTSKEGTSLQDNEHHPRHRRNTPRQRSNTPDGVPSHFEYIDGKWVPSSDWSLNGQNGSMGNKYTTTSSEHNDDVVVEAGEDGVSTSNRQNNASTGGGASSSSNRDESGSQDGNDGDSAMTTLGWAKSTNAILGVDIDTSLNDDVLSSSTSPTHAVLGLATRTNMPTFTPASQSSTVTLSTSSISSSSSSSSAATATATSTNTNNNNDQTTISSTYDFSRDVPNGWISDGRTAAYAVPVIIGLSIFLACIIFGLILILLRMNKTRKRRRKLNRIKGGKMVEEGKIVNTTSTSRPSSPVVSNSSSVHGGDGDAGDEQGDGHTTPRRGVSSALNLGQGRRGQRSEGAAEDRSSRSSLEDGNDEKQHGRLRRRLGRKWSPNSNATGLGGGTFSLHRKNGKKLVSLFNRRDKNIPEEAKIIQVDSEPASTTTVATATEGGDGVNENGRLASSGGNGHVGDGDDEHAGIRRRSISSREALQRRDTDSAQAHSSLSRDDHLGRIASHTSVGREEGEAQYIQPPPLRVETGSNPSTTLSGHASNSPHTTATSTLPVSPSGLSSATSSSAASGALPPPHSRRNLSIDVGEGDLHAVPIPSVGPPAYMQPSTPAYESRSSHLTAAVPFAQLSSAAGARGGSSSTAASGLEMGASGAAAAAIPLNGYLSALSTPGIMSAGMDEKRALMDGFGSGNAGDPTDAFRSQRQYEHLYASREGEEARQEQSTGAASLLPFASASSSASAMTVTTRSREDEEAIREAIEEAEESRRRELQANLVGHVAISDKELLGRLRMAASAPSQPPSQLAPAESSSSLRNEVADFSTSQHQLEASAPSFDEAEEHELDSQVRSLPSAAASAAAATSSFPTTSAPLAFLPRPPQAFQSSLDHLIPQVDEKTRLRQIEDSQLAREFASLAPSAPPPSPAPLSSSSAPSSPATGNDASVPSAPVFEDVEATPSAPPFAMPSAPPFAAPSAPSAPEYSAEEDGEDNVPSAPAMIDQDVRRYDEGVI